MASITIKADLDEEFTKIFGGTANAGQNYTIQNTTTVPIYFREETTDDPEPSPLLTGLILYPGKAGAVLDITGDVWFRAATEKGAVLTYSQRVESV